jgi:hypothetical protein
MAVHLLFKLFKRTQIGFDVPAATVKGDNLAYRFLQGGKQIQILLRPGRPHDDEPALYLGLRRDLRMFAPIMAGGFPDNCRVAAQGWLLGFGPAARQGPGTIRGKAREDPVLLRVGMPQHAKIPKLRSPISTDEGGS